MLVSAVAVAVVGVNVFTLVSLAMNDVPQHPAMYFAFAVLIAIYVGLIAYFALGPKK